MIIAFFILGVFAICLLYVWTDLSELIAEQLEEIGAGGRVEDRVPSAMLTATLTPADSAAGADYHRLDRLIDEVGA